MFLTLWFCLDRSGYYGLHISTAFILKSRNMPLERIDLLKLIKVPSCEVSSRPADLGPGAS